MICWFKETVSMAKGKELEEIDRGRTKSSHSQSNAVEPSDNAIGVPKPDYDRSEAYEACMQAYRWLSRRYRKTLDALAK
jgi:hypothetical protein